MNLDVQVFEAGGVAIVRCRGRLVFGHGATTLRDVARLALSDGHAVALDLGAVTQIDAHGAGVLAELSADAQRAGVPLRVVRAGARVRHLLRLTHLEAMMASPGEPGAIGWHPRVIIGGAPYRQADVADAFAVSARCGVH